jgi:hypothetical protein
MGPAGRISMNVELKAVKTAHHLSQETIAFSAKIYVDGKRIGVVSNSGTGGGNQYDWYEGCAKIGHELEAYAQTLTFEFEYDKLDQFINRLADEIDEKKWLKRNCKNKTMFRLKDDATEPGEGWRIVKRKFNRLVAAQLRQKYGDKLAVIANEAF